MPDDPSATDSLAVSVDDIIHQAIFNVALRSAKAELIGQAPWLEFPGINAIFTFIMDRIGSLLYKPLARFATFQVIEFQTDEERGKYEKAEGTLRAANLSGDANAVEIASAQFDEMLGNLIHFDGSAPI